MDDPKKVTIVDGGTVVLPDSGKTVSLVVPEYAGKKVSLPKIDMSKLSIFSRKNPEGEHPMKLTASLKRKVLLNEPYMFEGGYKVYFGVTPGRHISTMLKFNKSGTAVSKKRSEIGVKRMKALEKSGQAAAPFTKKEK